MEQDCYNFINIIISVISLAVTIIGLRVAYIQIRKLRKDTWSNMHSRLCDQSFEILKFFNDNPITYDYFYNNKELDENSPDKVTVLYSAEALANFLEHLLLQKENLPKEQWMVWERFINSTFASSIVVKEFINKREDWYSKELVKIANKRKKED